MAQQTAVQFLINYMLENFHLTDYTVMVVFEQAKQMEKEQMFGFTKEFHIIGESTNKYFTEEFEQYYNETYSNDTNQDI